MADNDNPTMKNKPNSLDRIGSDDTSSKRYSSFSLTDQRSRIETVEMQKIKQQIADLNRQKAELMREVGSVRAGQSQATETLFRQLGLSSKEARAAMRLPPENLPRAVGRQADIYLTQFEKLTASLLGEYGQKQEARQLDAARLFQQNVISRVSNPRAGIKAITGGADFSRAAETLAEISTPETLSKGLERLSRSREVKGIELAEAAGDHTPEGRKKYLKLEKEYEERLRKEFSIEAAQKAFERKTVEAEKTRGRGERTASDILERRGDEAIRAGVKGGEFGNIKDVMAKLKTAEDAFLSSLGKFSAELDKTGKVTADTRNEFEKANEEYSKQNKIFKEMSSGGGGGGGGGFSGINSKMQSALPYAMQAMQLAQMGLVGVDLQQLALRGQAAAFKNQEYFDKLSAARGDMAALRRVTTDLYGRSAAIGGTYGSRAEIISGGIAAAQTGAGAVDAGGSLLSTATAGVLGGGSAGQGLSNIMQGATTGLQVAKGVTRAQVEIQAAGLNRDLENQIYAARDAANQAMYDFRMSAYGSMMGTGTMAGKIYETAISKENVARLSNFGMAPEQGAALFGLGARAIGADFARSKDRGAGIVARAAELQQARIMSGEDYIQRVGQMANVGGGRKEVEEILSTAVRRGVDDAKSLEGLYNMAEALSRSNASMGISGALETQRALTRGLDVLGGAPMNEMLKQNVVSSAYQRAQDVSARTGQDIQTIGFFNKIKTIDPSVNMLQAINIAKMKPEQIRSIEEQYFKNVKTGEQVNQATIAALSNIPGALRTFLTDDFKFKGSAAVRGIEAALITKGVAYSMAMVPSNVRKEIEDFATGKIEESQLSKEAIMASENYPGGLVGLRTMRPDRKKFRRLPSGTRGEFKPGALTGDIADAERAAAAGAISMETQINQAPGTMEAASKGMMALARSANVGAATGRAIGAAESLTLDATAFNTSVGDFKIAVDKLVDAVTPLSKEGIVKLLTTPSTSSEDPSKQGFLDFLIKDKFGIFMQDTKVKTGLPVKK